MSYRLYCGNSVQNLYGWTQLAAITKSEKGSKQTAVKMPGQYCAVESCLSSTKTAKENGIRFFSIPSDFDEDWRRVLNKRDKAWQPKKSSRICSKHFTKGDINGMKLRPGAIPIPEPFIIPVIEGKIFPKPHAISSPPLRFVNFRKKLSEN